MFVEMKNLRQKANIIEYSTATADLMKQQQQQRHHYNNQDSNDVDRVIEMPMLSTGNHHHNHHHLNHQRPATSTGDHYGKCFVLF